MLFVNWYEIDWFFWDWVFIFLLISIILILRFFRRIFRWKLTYVHGVHRSKSEITMGSHKISINNYNAIPYKNSSKIDSILVIPPYLSLKRNIDPLCSALALRAKEVYLLPATPLVESLSNSSHDVIINQLSSFIITENIRNLIVFDIFTGIGVDLKKFTEDKGHKVNIVYIRPIFNKKNLKSPFNLRILLSSAPAFLFNFALSFSKKPKKSFFEIYSGFSLNEVESSNRQYFLLPSTSLERNESEMVQNLCQIKSNNLLIEKFSRGGWSFFHQETILLGLIFSFLEESKF